MISKNLTKSQNAIGLLILFCAVLQLLRVQYTQSLTFSFLLWNLFLATIPYCITELIKKSTPSKPKLFGLIFIWLLFLPNAPYIITDFIHLRNSKSAMLWFDLFLIFSFACTSLVIALVSMNDMHKVMHKKWNLKTATKFINSAIILCGFGIYLGRFLRFNSWDIFTQPLFVVKRSVFSFSNSQTWYITLGFASLLWILFSVFRSFTELKIKP